MADLIKKKVTGTGTIPKFNMRPPLIICETEDFFNQLVAMGFKVESIEEETSISTVKEAETTNENDSSILVGDVSINVIGGVKIDPIEETVVFTKTNESTDYVEAVPSIDTTADAVIDNTKVSINTKKNNKKKK